MPIKDNHHLSCIPVAFAFPGLLLFGLGVFTARPPRTSSLFAPYVTHQWTFAQLVQVKKERRGALLVTCGGRNHSYCNDERKTGTCCYSSEGDRATMRMAMLHLLSDWVAVNHLLVIFIRKPDCIFYIYIRVSFDALIDVYIRTVSDCIDCSSCHYLLDLSNQDRY